MSPPEIIMFAIVALLSHWVGHRFGWSRGYRMGCADERKRWHPLGQIQAAVQKHLAEGPKS